MKHSFVVNFSHAAKRIYWKHINGNKTAWILSAMADKYHKETGRSAHFVIEEERRRLVGADGSDAVLDYVEPAPVVEPPPAIPTPPQRIGWWLPTSEEMETGIYAVVPDTFAVNDEGAWHFVQVVPGPSYSYGDNWQGIKAKWKPAETPGPFTPSPGVLSAAIAADAARVAALIARHPR